MSAEHSGKSHGDLFFAVDARHVRQLGQQLVGDRVTAVSELIKNAYDADATQVAVAFATADSGTLTVSDDGSGMSLDDVVGRWMRIATNDKELHATSSGFHRARAGRKGIGRFAAQTLGRRLELRTTVAGSSIQTVVEFDWDHEYATGRELGTVPNPWRTEPAPPDQHGTTLSIRGLYDEWSVDDFDRVAKAIRMLQPPFPLLASAKTASPLVVISASDSAFSVVLTVDGHPAVADPVEGFLEAATALVEGDVTPDGTVSVYASGPRIGLDRIEDLPVKYFATGPLTFRAAYFVYRRDTIGGYGLRDAEQMGRRYGGVRVYRDGLRVLPYGEPENDWLGLDLEYRSRSRTLVPIGNRNVFGQVLLTREANPELEDRASREGFIENVAYAQLRELLKEALVRSAIWVGEVRQRKTRASAKAAPSPTRGELLSELSSSVERIVRDALPEADADHLMAMIATSLDDVTSSASSSDETESSRTEALLGELELLRVLASLGTSIAVFSHEVRGALNGANAAIELLSLRADAEDERDLALARKSIRRLQEIATYIDSYVSNSRRRQRVAQPMDRVLADFVEQFCANFSVRVTVEYSVEPSGLRTVPMTRSELDAVLINLYTNAIKAMDGEKASSRRVRIAAVAESGMVSLRFQDTGSGIDPKIADVLFEPFVSTSRASVSELGAGSGLGLKIVADIADDYGGNVEITEPDAGFATCVAFRVPQWEEQALPPVTNEASQ